MPSRHYAVWTAEEDRLLREVLAEGASTDEAAEELGRTRRATQQRAWDLRIKRPMGGPIDSVKRGRVLELLGKGLSLNEIARILGRHNSVIVRMAQELAKAGLVKRVGGVTRAVRYVPCNDKELRCATKDSMR